MSELKEVSVARFFYENRDLAGFSSPTRAVFTAVREFIENALDATESMGILPEIKVQIREITLPGNIQAYELTVEDNGCGVPEEQVPMAFGKILVSSKYKLQQMRGVFGLGGKMAILYSQITTHQPAKVWTSTGGKYFSYFEILIDINKNEPIVLKRKKLPNPKRKSGTKISIAIVGNYRRAARKIYEYIKRTAMVAPYAEITYITPTNEVFHFKRATTKMPKPPTETLPHPHGVDLELLTRVIEITKTRNMVGFLTTHFHRIGEKTAKRFLEFCGINPRRNPKKLTRDELVRLMNKMHEFRFLPPKADCLSPIGEEIFRAGIEKELEPEFIAVHQRKPSAYGGHPFIVEVAVAYGGKIPARDKITVYRFANRIPLIYDEGGDAIVSLVRSFNWRRYRVSESAPLVVFVHLCSTKIPYKTVGKEIIAERPEIQREVLNGLHNVARELRLFLSRKARRQRERQRLEVYKKYLTKISRFSAEVIKRKPPDITIILKKLIKYSEVSESEEKKR
ncbi:MAG TPA: DNA topoisomerase VI subunit B [Thermococcus sp.]|nr:DNA topoisomerase VI subunit B [Thermococcus sp.]